MFFRDSIAGHFGTSIPSVIMKRRSRARKEDITSISCTRFTASAQSRTSGECITTFTASKRSCPTPITCSSRKELSQSGRMLTIGKEASGLLPYLSKMIWKKNAVKPGLKQLPL